MCACLCLSGLIRTQQQCVMTHRVSSSVGLITHFQTLEISDSSVIMPEHNKTLRSESSSESCSESCLTLDATSKAFMNMIKWEKMLQWGEKRGRRFTFEGSVYDAHVA